MTPEQTGTAEPGPRSRLRSRLLTAAVLSAAAILSVYTISQSPSTSRLSQHVSSSLRRRLKVVVPTDPTFQWNGSTSDLAQQYYKRHVEGATADALSYTDGQLPASIQTRLQAHKLSFPNLPPLLQRALVWDSGYAFSPAPDRKFIRIYTTNGVSMADIAVSMPDYLSTGCNTTNCSDPNGFATYRSKTCSGSMMLSVSHCASEEVVEGVTHMSMWATGGDPMAIPTMNIERHSWFDKVFLQDYLVFAVHTTADEYEPAWDYCPDRNDYGSVIIPCDSYTAARAAEKNWKDPAPSALVEAWLQQTKEEYDKFPIVYVIPIICGLAVLALGVYGYIRYRRKYRGNFNSDKGSSAVTSTLDQALMTPKQTKQPHHQDPYMIATDSLIAYRGAARQFSTHNLLTALLNDPNLRSRRLNYDKIVFERDLAKGAFGEVWLCKYESSVVAVKRLLQTKKRTSEDVHAFIDEIQLSATLDHPNIMKIIGVAWNTLENLCMVMEYLSKGDLQAYLRRNGEGMTWSRNKLPLATGVARALQYLHCRSPPLIHRDVKARNVLLTENCQTKLIDFGVSRSYGDCCMTVGVGTPYWTAPEVLEGTVYSEKSDIYSFGVLLSELDTCTAPYHDAKTSGHNEPLQPFHILKLVMAGTLKPNFTAACPVQIQTIADLCLRRDPAQRPSAIDVVAMLEALGGSRESF